MKKISFLPCACYISNIINFVSSSKKVTYREAFLRGTTTAEGDLMIEVLVTCGPNCLRPSSWLSSVSTQSFLLEKTVHVTVSIRANEEEDSITGNHVEAPTIRNFVPTILLLGYKSPVQKF